jgi:hypothetical protein
MWVAGILSDLVAYVRHLDQRAGGSLAGRADEYAASIAAAAGTARVAGGDGAETTPGPGDALSLPPVLGARPGSVVPHVDALPANVLR